MNIDKLLDWQTKSFAALTPLEVYQMLQLRNAVFMVEQEEVYQDTDWRDIEPRALHVFAWSPQANHAERPQIAAYARILPPNAEPSYVHIGRVIVAKPYRGQGLGRELMQKTLEALAQSPFQSLPIEIFAQTRLTKFYQSFGFSAVGENYYDGRLLHTRMVRSAMNEKVLLRDHASTNFAC